MKDFMAPSLQTVVLVLLWNAAEVVAMLRTSGTSASAKALMTEREDFEARSHAQLSHWCNATLPAQGSRRSALQHLLLQAQGAQAPSSPEAPDLMQLESQAAAFGGQLERQRLQTQASQSMREKEMASLKFDLDDANHDVQALQAAYDHLAGAKNVGNNGLKAAAKLLTQAKETQRKAQAKVTLLQSQSSAVSSSNLSQVELEYRNKKADIVSFQHQFFTTQRSLDVLTSALEDESGYLSDLQSICGAELQVQARLATRVMPMLREMVGLVSHPAPEAAVAKAAPKVTPAAAPKAAAVQAPAPKVTPAAAAAPKAAAVQAPAPKIAAPKAPAASKPAAKKPARKSMAAKVKLAVQKKKASSATKKAKSVKTAAKKAKAVKTIAAFKKLAAAKVAAAKPAAPKAAVAAKPKTHKKVAHKKVNAPKPAAAKPVAAVARKHKSHKKTKAVPAVQKKLKSKAKKVVAAKAPPAPKALHKAPKKTHAAAKPTPAPVAAPMKDPFADDDDDDAAPLAAPATKHTTAAVAKPVVKPVVKHTAKPKTKAPTAPAPMKDPFADGDDDDTPAPPPAAPPAPPAPKPKHHKRVQAPPPAPEQETPAAPAKMKDPFADDDDDDTSAPPPPAPKAKHHAAPKHQKPAKKAAQDSSKDSLGIYDSAAGNVPSTYAAWSPNSAAAEPVTKSVSAAAAKKQMMAMLGGDSDDDSTDSTSPKASVPPPAAPAKMKDPFADDDDATPAATAPKSTPPAAPGKMKDPFADDDDDSTAAAPPKAAKAPVVEDVAPPAPKPVAAPVADDTVAPAKSAEAAGVKSAEAAFDADDDSSSSKPAAKSKAAITSLVDTEESDDAAAEAKTKAATAKAASAAFDGDDDSFDAKSAFDAAKKPAADDADTPKVAGKAMAAMQSELDSDGAVDKFAGGASQLQMPESHKKKPEGKANFQDSVYDAAAGNLPNQYAAWTPTEKASANSKSKQELNQMEADFDDDDDSPTPAPKKKKRHHRHSAEPTAPPPPPQPKPDADGVVYDDDDLPKHHVNTMVGLEGGWQSFMKKSPEKKMAAPKLDPDVAIMESLYTKDGGLPSQYTAWSPDGPAPVAAAPQQQQVALAQEDSSSSSASSPMDLEAAAKSFEANPDAAFDFLQLRIGTRYRDVVADAIHRASAPSTSSLRGTAFLEASTMTIDMARMAAAGIVLEQYAEVLKSKPLHQLAKAKLSPTKLQALYQQLRNVDPLVGKSPAAAQGKQAQAEQMCKYFQEHMQAAAPVQKAVSLVEGASNDLAESVSRRAALLEEIDARTQLQRTMGQDMSSLKTLAALAKQGEDTSSFEALGKQFTGATAMAIGASAEGVQGAHEEIKDLLDLAIQKRSAVHEAQSKKLTELQADVKKADSDLAQKKTRAATSQAAMETARKKLAGITTSCDATLDALAKRRHAGHMEAHAIEVALEVLGSE